jgi:N-methylhydantoinase B/oxoprolinase/acetone carboxylase alpha subunit
VQSQANALAVDQITLQVVNNHLITTAREMGTAMRNTAYSPLFNEGLDFSCAVFDDRGEMVAQAEFCPSHLGAIRFVVEWTILEIGLENFADGDITLHNDPYRGGCHLPEYCVIKPVFSSGVLVGFVACIGHMTEIGGKTPGGFAGDATDIFQEGLRLPPLKIVEEGRDNETVWNIIMANVRTPRASYGDLKAMIGALYVGEQRLQDLVDKHGIAAYRQICDAIKDYSERRMRAEIHEIPDGVYEFADPVIENDGITSEPSWLRVRLTVAGDELTVDYTGSDQQRRGPVNCTYGVTASATYTALLHIVGETLSPNHGCYRPIRIIAPPGTIVNVDYPASCVGGNSLINPHIIAAVYGALGQAIPDRIPAQDGGTASLCGWGGVHPETGEVFVNLTIEGCGWGALATHDGNDVLCIPNGNCPVTPIEILETRYPILHEGFGLQVDSGGPGRFRGGLGSYRDFRIECDEITLSCFDEREEIPPWGVFGGAPASCSTATVRLAGTDDFVTFKEIFGVACNGKFSDVRLARGDTVRIVTAGGGGYGDPATRDVAAIEHDLQEGFVSVAHVEDDYKVTIISEGTTVNDPATVRRLLPNQAP